MKTNNKANNEMTKFDKRSKKTQKHFKNQPLYTKFHKTNGWRK